MLLISVPLSHGGIRDVVVANPAARPGRVLAARPTSPCCRWPRRPSGGCRWPIAIVVSGLAGVANARAWFGLVRAVTRKADRRTVADAWPLLRLPLAPLAAVLSIALVIGMTRLAFVVGRGPRQVGVEAAAIQAGGAGTGRRGRGQPG